MDLARAVTDFGGGAHAGQLLARGATRRQLAGAVRGGGLEAVGRAGYVLPGARPPIRTAVRMHGSLTCVSALDVHGFALLRDPVVPHLSSPRHRTGGGCMWHRGPLGPLVADELTAAAAALRCLDGPDALAVADQVLRRGWEPADLLRRLPLRGNARARVVATRADRRAESVLESALRWHLLEAGLGDLDLQVEVPGIGRVDLVVQRWLIVEADGYTHHGGLREFMNDRRRVATGLADGRLTLRLSYGDVLGDADQVVTTIRDILRRRQAEQFRTLVTIAPAVETL